MSRLPLFALAALVLFLVLLIVIGMHRPASFRFPVEPGRSYEVTLLEKPGLRMRYTYTLRDQDGQDRDRSVGHYELRVPNAEGADFEVRREARSETRRPLLERTELPLLPATPFPQGQRAWVTLSETVRKLQGGDGVTGATGRIVDFSGGDQPAILGEGCDVAMVAVHPGGRALAVVRPVGDGHRLEVWTRRPDERWERSTLLAELNPPVDPIWEGEAILFLERQTIGGTLRRWRPFERTPPEPVAVVPGAHRLLAESKGLLWLSAGEEGEFLLVDGTGGAIPFRAHPSLQLLRAYLAPQDAFLVRFPALDREGIDLVLRRRLGETSTLIRRLPESVLLASASSDLAVVVGVEKCGDPVE